MFQAFYTEGSHHIGQPFLTWQSFQGFILADMEGLLEISLSKIWELHFSQVFSACLEKRIRFHRKEVKIAKGASRKEKATGTMSHGVPLEEFIPEELRLSAIVMGMRRGCLSKRLQGPEEDDREQFCGALVDMKV